MAITDLQSPLSGESPQETLDRDLDPISTPTEDEFLELLESEQARNKLAQIIEKLLFERRLTIEPEFLRACS